MELTMENLKICFEGAKRVGIKYIAIKVQMYGFEKPEIIINEYENFDKKLAYYQTAYNEDLTLKSFNGIKIIGFMWGNNFNMIETALVQERGM